MTTENFKPNPLVIGSYPVKSSVFNITGSGVIAAGTPLKSSNGTSASSAQASADASTTIGVAAYDIDLSGGAVDASIYVSGEFSGSALVLEGSMTADQLSAAWRTRGLPLFVG